MRFRSIAVLFVVVSMMACGGSGGGSDPSPEPVISPPSDPVVSAGEDQSVVQGQRVTLAAAFSGADVSGYEWEQTSGELVSLSGAQTKTALFDAPNVSIQHELAFRFKVLAVDGRTFVDDVKVTVQLNPRFRKFSIQGAELSATAADWGCTLDTETGLYWEKKSAQSSVGHHYVEDRFTWYREGAGYRLGSSDPYEDCNVTLFGYCNTENAERMINSTGLCGFTDWRLPTLAEFRSLGSPDRDFFTFASSFDNGNTYWTSDSNGIDGALTYSLVSGDGGAVFAFNFPWYVMLVR